MDAADAERDAVRKANELYWSSDLSVNHIAEQMDLSKGAFYALIHPEPAGFLCPDCRAEAAFGNRTAKARGDAECPRCGWEGTTGEGRGDLGDAAPSPPSAEEGDAGLPSAPPAPRDPVRSRVMVGGALLGAAAGLALVLWTRRR